MTAHRDDGQCHEACWKRAVAEHELDRAARSRGYHTEAEWDALAATQEDITESEARLLDGNR